MSLVLPQSTVRLINSVVVNHRHPGLQLDKFSVAGDQTAQKSALTKVCNNPGDAALLTTLIERRKHLVATLPGAESFSSTTTGPLTLHLARASALENAGICLHPLYGFAYLPGSGLKGMARAFAETIWLPSQPDQKQAWRQIKDVFGWAAHLDRRQQINDSTHPAEVRRQDITDPESPEIKATSGNIVFHDAWPESWPKLIVDIVNNHHPEYYQHDDNNYSPGDWENPVPVYFLAVKPGTTFTFPLAKRRADVADQLLELARQWLLGALCHFGAGAKTNAGYGAFEQAGGDPPQLPNQKRAVFETTLELVTPAFLAGANQEAGDCALRSATLRGMLRWWWRTMHAGFVDVKTLRALEAAIWGDTNGGGAVRIVIEKDCEKDSSVPPQPYDKRRKAKSDDSHKNSKYGIPSESNPKKITPGLWYASYGMDETNRRRYYLERDTRWRLRLTARQTRFFINRKDAANPRKANGKDITAEQALSQAKAALWLLCHFGGIGSKARKGFGSLAADQLQDHKLETCQDAANQLRQHLELSNSFDGRRAHSSSLQQMLAPLEVSFSWPNVWNVLDQVGFAYQTFAKKYKHQREKMALGLPRRIGKPIQGTFKPTPPVTADGRHSSPVHIHVEGKPHNWTVRTIAFPAAHLPDLNTSRTFLEEFLKEFGHDLHRRAGLPPPSGSSGVSRSTRPSSASSPSIAGSAPVRVTFLGPHEKLKNAFWVQETGKRRGLLKYGTPPVTLPAEGTEIEVYRTNNNPNSPEYRWDSPPAHRPSRDGPGGKTSRGRN
jgi:CRISPR-associated protein Cmr6